MIKKEEKFFVLKMEDIEDYFARYQEGYFMNDEGTKLHQAWDTVIKGICEMRKSIRLRRNDMPPYLRCGVD